MKHRDGWATTEIDITGYAPQSVVSGRGVEEVDGGSVRISNRKTARVRTVADRVRAKKAPSEKSVPRKK